MALNLVSHGTKYRTRRAGSNPCRYVVAVVASARGIRPMEMLHPTRSRPAVAGARQLAMYLSHVLLGMTMTEVGRFFGRDRTTVAHACALVEDAREDPLIDRDIDALEMAVHQRVGAAQLALVLTGESTHAAR